MAETYSQVRPFVSAVQQAAEWILGGSSRAGRPTFTWVHLNNAHQPYVAPDAPAGVFVGDEHYDPGPRVQVLTQRTLPLQVAADHPCRQQILRADLGGVHPGAVLKERPTELAYYLARYDAGILGADRVTGLLLQRLRAAGRLARTLVVVVGDHGESLGEHGYYFRHGRFPYDTCLRVPLLMRLPGGGAARRVAAPVSTLGLMPTLLRLAGLAIPPGVEGSGLLPPPAPDAAVAVFAEAGYQLDYSLTVRDRQHKLIFVPNPQDRSLMRGGPYELYDLRADPGETRDLHAARPEVVGRLRAVLERWSAPWIKTAYARPSGAAPRVSPAVLQRLRALGYVE